MSYSMHKSQGVFRARGFRAVLAGCLLLGIVPLAGAGRAEEPRHEVSPHLYVFISASLTTGELAALARDSASLQAPMLLRGLVGSSLQETLLNLKDVVAQGAALEVDPLLFETYGVDAVPAVVLTCGARGEGPFALVYGLSPSQALPILRKVLPAC